MPQYVGSSRLATYVIECVIKILKLNYMITDIYYIITIDILRTLVSIVLGLLLLIYLQKITKLNTPIDHLLP